MATSRLCVKNLPRHATEARLREHFGSKGEVTDVKILRTRRVRSHSPLHLPSAAAAGRRPSPRAADQPPAALLSAIPPLPPLPPTRLSVNSQKSAQGRAVEAAGLRGLQNPGAGGGGAALL